MKKLISSVLISFILCTVAFAQNSMEETFVSYKKVGTLKTKTTHQIEASNWSVGGETMDHQMRKARSQMLRTRLTSSFKRTLNFEL